MAMKAWKLAKYVKSLVNVERKFCDTVQTASAISNAGVVQTLSAISEGNDFNQRAGLSVKATSLQCRYTVELPSGFASPEGQYFRQIIFIDKDNQGSAPVSSDVLESVTLTSPLNHTNGARFTILMDKTIFMSIAGQTGIQRTYYSKMSHHLKYSNSTTGTREGQVYALWLTDGVGAGTNPILNFYSRIRYVDN